MSSERTNAAAAYFSRGHTIYIIVSIVLIGVATYLVTRSHEDDITASLIVSTLAIILRAGEFVWLRERVEIIIAPKRDELP